MVKDLNEKRGPSFWTRRLSSNVLPLRERRQRSGEFGRIQAVAFDVVGLQTLPHNYAETYFSALRSQNHLPEHGRPPMDCNMFDAVGE
jgi:hypothetical protein